MLIIDGDYPMTFGAVKLQRDLTLPIDQVRARTIEAHGERGWPDEGTMASLPEMRKGGLAVALVKVSDCCILRPGHEHGDHRTDILSYAAGRGFLGYYHMLETMGETRLLKSPGEFKEHMGAWISADNYDRLPVGMVLGMEGADPIVWPQQVHEWFEAGLRVISLSHYGVSRYSHGTGTGTGGGLLDGAEELLREMDSLGMILDVSHTSDESVRQELDIFEGPVLASHQNCRAVCPGERQFPDHQLREAHRARSGYRPLDGCPHVVAARTGLDQPPGQEALHQGGRDPGELRRPHRPRLPAGWQLLALGHRRGH